MTLEIGSRVSVGGDTAAHRVIGTEVVVAGVPEVTGSQVYRLEGMSCLYPESRLVLSRKSYRLVVPSELVGADSPEEALAALVSLLRVEEVR